LRPVYLKFVGGWENISSLVPLKLNTLLQDVEEPPLQIRVTAKLIWSQRAAPDVG